MTSSSSLSSRLDGSDGGGSAAGGLGAGLSSARDSSVFAICDVETSVPPGSLILATRSRSALKSLRKSASNVKPTAPAITCGEYRFDVVENELCHVGRGELCRIIRHLGSGIVWGGTLTLPRQSSRSQQLALVPWDEIEQRIRRAFLNAVSTRICPFSLICAFAARLLIAHTRL